MTDDDGKSKIIAHLLEDRDLLLTNLEWCVKLIDQANPGAFNNEVSIGGSGDEGEAMAGKIWSDTREALRKVKGHIYNDT